MQSGVSKFAVRLMRSYEPLSYRGLFALYNGRITGINGFRHFGTQRDRSVKFVFEEEKDEPDSESARLSGRLGNVRLGSPDLPVKLTIAINRAMMKFDPQKLRADALVLREKLINRKRPAKTADIRKRAKVLEREMLGNADMKGLRSKLSHEEVRAMTASIEEEVLPKIRSEFHHWIRMDYSPYVCAQYLLNRFPEEYGVLTKIFSEIKQRVPDFAPASLLDYGSGVASVAFAADSVFKNSMKEYFCVDISSSMNDLAKEIINNGTDGEEPLLSKTYFRQHFPGSHERKYDLVVSAYSMLELPSTHDRMMALRSLWQKTSRFLVLVELGNSEGYQLIMEARNHLLRIDSIGKPARNRERLDEQLEPGHVFSPCPHDFVCPRLAGAQTSRVMCHFPISFRPLPFMSSRNTPRVTSRYSYLVMEKTSAPRTEEESWPRTVEDVLKKHHCTTCRLCCSDGTLKESVITKSKEPVAYPLIRAARWGDRLPLVVAPKTEQDLQADRDAAEVRRLRMERAELNRSRRVDDSEVYSGEEVSDPDHYTDVENTNLEDSSEIFDEPFNGPKII